MDEQVRRPRHPAAPEGLPADAPQPLNLFDGVVSPPRTSTTAVFDERKDPRCFTEIGTGMLPIQDIIDAAGDATEPRLPAPGTGPHHLDEIESIRRSRDAFATSFTGITWPPAAVD